MGKLVHGFSSLDYGISLIACLRLTQRAVDIYEELGQKSLRGSYCLIKSATGKDSFSGSCDSSVAKLKLILWSCTA